MDEMRAISEQLARPPAGAPEVDLVARVIERAALPPPRPRVARLALGAAIGFAVAASLAVLIGAGASRESVRDPSGAASPVEIASAAPSAVGDAPEVAPDDDPAFQARGGARSDASRWIALRPFRVDVTGRTSPLPRTGGRLDARDALLLAYDNVGPRPYRHLAAFAVETGADPGRSGAVHWLYPDSAGASSIAIEPGAARELRDELRLPVTGDRLVLYALFSRAPLADEALARLARAARDGQPELLRELPPDTGVDVIPLQVEHARR